MITYAVEYRHRGYNDSWTLEYECDDLTDAIEHAARECVNNPRMQHRIVKVHAVEQVMFLPSIEDY